MFYLWKNHYADKCPNKYKGNEPKENTNDKKGEDSNKKKDVPSDNEKKEDKTEATINLTTGDKQNEDWSEWDQNVDCSGLMFFSLRDDVDDTKSDLTPDYKQLEVNVEHAFKQLSAEAKVNAL